MLAGFRWILPGSLAGSARPGLLRALQLDLAFVRAQGIARIVSLTSKPLPIPEMRGDLQFIHFPIADMGIPTPRACALLCRSLVDDLAARPVLLHCHGGLGRTGTIAACCLIHLGHSPQEALRRVRQINANYVQTAAQVGFLGHYAEWVNHAGE